MANNKVVITGFDRLRDALEKLPDEVKQQALKIGVKAGAEVIADAVRAKAPLDTGRLRDSVQVKAATRLRNKDTAVGYRVTVGGDGKSKDDPYYAYFIEYGYMKQETRVINGRIWSLPRGTGTPTWIPPKPFVRPALEQSSEAAKTAISNAVRNVVSKLNL